MTVYVIQRVKDKDLTPAERFGRLDVLFTRGCYPDDRDRRVAEMIEIARAKLRHFDPETDHVMLIGDPVGISVVTAVLAEKHETIPVLKWDKYGSDYYSIRIPTTRKEPQHENDVRKQPARHS